MKVQLIDFVFPVGVDVEECGCWRPIRTKGLCHFNGGYSKAYHKGKRWSGHRLSYHLNSENIERSVTDRKSNMILHRCDNKWCVNPNHLYLGTAKDNVRDLLERNEKYRKHMLVDNIGNKYAQGRKRPVEECEAISKALKGMPKSEEHRQKLREANIGKKQSQETINKKRAALIGKRRNDETRDRMRKAWERRRENKSLNINQCNMKVE